MNMVFVFWDISRQLGNGTNATPIDCIAPHLRENSQGIVYSLTIGGGI